MKTIKTLFVKSEPLSEKLIYSAGFDTYNNTVITEKYVPITVSQYGMWEYKLFTFGQETIQTEQILLHIESEGFKPAKIGHLVSFYETEDYSKKTCTMYVALGSHFKKSMRFSPCFMNENKKWDLNICIHNRVFDKERNIFFLAIKKMK
jgi:hypothetical protein